MLKCSVILLLLLNIWMGGLPAQTPNYHWATKFDSGGATGFGLDDDDQFVVDAQGSSYLLQRIVDQIQYGDTTLYSDPEAGAYALAKYDAAGKFQWARTLVGLDEDGVESRWGYLNSLIVDPAGNILISGEYDTPQFFAGMGDPVRNPCPEEYCNALFIVTYSAGGQLLKVEQHYAFGAPPDAEYYGGADSPVLNIDASGQRHLVFNLYGDTLVWNGQKQYYGSQNYQLLLTRSLGAGKLEQIGSIQYDNGGFYPLKLIPQADGSVLLFGEASEETTLSDAYGFSYTTGPLIEGSSLEDIYLVIKYNAQGQVLWIRELHGEYAEAQLVADPQGHTYLMGYFETFLRWKQQTLREGEDEYGGFLFRLDEQGEIVWQKIYADAAIDVTLAAQVASVSPDGGLLAPLVILAPEGESSTTFEGQTVQAVWDGYTSAIGHYNLHGTVDTLVLLPAAGEGVFFVTNLRYDPNGRIYGLFQTAEVDTLRIGAYTFPVVEFTSEILACFTLSNLPPGFTAPKAATKVEKTTENLRIIRTYPNPTDNQLTVEWVPQATGVELLWSDAQGKVLQRFELEPYAQQYTLNVAQWPAGWYTLEWRGGGKRESVRVMKK
ncbi:T9SS type A sorting domain-containing protein [Haliscomenobacter sp.]|uniref:T9SS type A sorting domain-containing protein n=1 Tax=Haliscomenobacter sp. TaxID=2717303 RepID=UPI003593954F